MIIDRGERAGQALWMPFHRDIGKAKDKCRRSIQQSCSRNSKVQQGATNRTGGCGTSRRSSERQQYYSRGKAWQQVLQLMRRLIKRRENNSIQKNKIISIAPLLHLYNYSHLYSSNLSAYTWLNLWSSPYICLLEILYIDILLHRI